MEATIVNVSATATNPFTERVYFRFYPLATNVCNTNVKAAFTSIYEINGFNATTNHGTK
jgi:hypothetical protein